MEDTALDRKYHARMMAHVHKTVCEAATAHLEAGGKARNFVAMVPLHFWNPMMRAQIGGALARPGYQTVIFHTQAGPCTMMPIGPGEDLQVFAIEPDAYMGKTPTADDI